MALNYEGRNWLQEISEFRYSNPDLHRIRGWLTISYNKGYLTMEDYQKFSQIALYYINSNKVDMFAIEIREKYGYEV